MGIHTVVVGKIESSHVPGNGRCYTKLVIVLLKLLCQLCCIDKQVMSPNPSASFMVQSVQTSFLWLLA